MFITFEGGEGSGKTTQIALLADELEKRGFDVLKIREPGGTAAGEKIRAMLLSKESDGLDPMAELLLYEAARAQIVNEVVRPSVERGAIVLCDRFYDSTVAYQGYGRGLDVGLIDRLNMAATGGLKPDVTFLLSINPEQGLKRAMDVTGGDGEGDRIEAAGLEFHRRVAAGFAAIAANEPARVKIIDAAGSIEEIHRALMESLPEPLLAHIGC